MVFQYSILLWHISKILLLNFILSNLPKTIFFLQYIVLKLLYPAEKKPNYLSGSHWCPKHDNIFPLTELPNGTWLRGNVCAGYNLTDGYSLLPLASKVFMSDWKLFSLRQMLEKHFTVWDILFVEDGSKRNFEHMELPGSIFQI